MIRRWSSCHGRGFSVVEVLLAIMVLGIGIISIAALFPAGIAQQRQSVDDVVGPIVANNAMTILRTKLRTIDFGTFEQFGGSSPRPTIDGDWTWLRPAFIFNDPDYPPGTIDIFNATGAASAADIPTTPTFVPLEGIPYNQRVYQGEPPTIIITQRERYYPLGSDLGGSAAAHKPEYVWDCLFRRYQGRILVAIFVYRVTMPGGGDALYTVTPDPGNPSLPPVPLWLDLGGAAWDADVAVIPGTDPGSAFDPTDRSQGWQAPRQWLLDQNNNIHRLLAGRRQPSDGPVELIRGPAPVLGHMIDLPPPSPPTYSVNWYAGPIAPDGLVYDGVVTDLWYIPPQIDVDGNGTIDLRLTPVYLTVKEL